MGLNFTIDLTWGRLILLSISKKQPKKSVSRHKGCRQMVIESVHCGCSGILKVHFLGHPVGAQNAVALTQNLLIVCWQLGDTVVTAFRMLILNNVSIQKRCYILWSTFFSSVQEIHRLKSSRHIDSYMSFHCIGICTLYWHFVMHFAKDYLLADQGQACSKFTWLVVCLFICHHTKIASYIRKWLLTAS